MKKMSFSSKILFPLACLLAFSAPVGANEFITVLSGGTSGVYYPLGVALTNTASKTIPNAKCTTQATKASVENLNLLNAGRGEFAFTLGDSLGDAWIGNEEVGFKAPLAKLRGVTALYPNYIQIVARADAGVKTLADLKGKRISVGAPKSGTELNARAILKAAGLSYSDFSKVEYLSFGESVELMKNRQLDITLQSAGLGVAALRDLASAIDIVVVPVPADVVGKTGNPVYVPTIIPANTYKGQTADVPTASVINFLVTRADLSEETVYQITKALYSSLDDFVAAHSAAKEINLAHATTGMPVPLHSGAEKFYREVGHIK